MRAAIYFYVVFIVVYLLLVVTTSMFFLTWGAERNLLEKVYVFFIGSPFDWSVSLWYLPLNAFCWATVFFMLYRAFRFLQKSLL